MCLLLLNLRRRQCALRLFAPARSLDHAALALYAQLVTRALATCVVTREEQEPKASWLSREGKSPQAFHAPTAP